MRAEADALAQNRIELSPVVTEGLKAYLNRVIEDLKRIAMQSQMLNESENRFYRGVERAEKADEKGNANLITIADPFLEFRFASIRDLGFEKHYETSMVSNKEKEDERERERLKEDRPPDAPRETEGEERKKKVVFDEDHEIFKTIYKVKLEKTKDSGSSYRDGKEQNDAVRMFAEGIARTTHENDAFIRTENAHVSTGRSSESIFIKNKHLIHFLENDPYFRKSTHLLKAYFRSIS